MKKKFILDSVHPEEDVNFLNATCIDFVFQGPPNDSGWCDWNTGARILRSSDVIIFTTHSESDCIALELTFGKRIKDLLTL